MAQHTHRGEISRMREEDAPRIAKPLMKLDRTLSSLSLKVGGDASKTKRHCFGERIEEDEAGRV